MKSLHEYIIESIDEALRVTHVGLKSALNGRGIYLRGWERYEFAVFDRRLKQERREFKKELPLLSSDDPS